MRFDVADNHIVTIGAQASPFDQHVIGLADTWGSAEDDAQFAAPARLRFGPKVVAFEQLFRCGAGVVGCHHDIGYCSSRARLSFSTLTRGSPRNPRVRPEVLVSTIARTCSSVIPRCCAIRAICRSA